MRLGFVLRELEQPERAFDVDLVRRDRRELRARREQRREVEDQIDLEFRHQRSSTPWSRIEPVISRSTLRRDRGVQPADVDA